MRAVPAFILGALALVLAGLPYVAGYIAAPRGVTFLGALNNLGDMGQYLAAIRQGMDGSLLYTNQYTSLHVAPVLMYPLYTATGFLLQPTHMSPTWAYHLLHLGVAVALVAALWQCCGVFVPRRRALAFGLTLFGGGLYLPALLVSGLVRLPFAPVALTAPELSPFAALLISPHGTLGLAAETWALTGYLLWRRSNAARHLIALAVGGLAVGLSYPFGLPVVLAVIAVDSAVAYWSALTPRLACDCGRMANHGDCGRTSRIALHPASSWWLRLMLNREATFDVAGARSDRSRRLLPCDRSRRPSLNPTIIAVAALALALLPALGVALYYEALFHHDPLWGASNMLRLPPPGPALLLTAFGPLVALGLVPALVSSTRRHALLASVTGRLLVVWSLVNGLLLVTPLPQSERLLNGWAVPLALLATMRLCDSPRLRTAQRWAIAMSLSNVMMALLYLGVAAAGRNAAYYAPASETAAVQWLAAHATSRDVVMASAGSGNLIVSAARCHVVSGQNFETFNWARVQRDVFAYYAPRTPTSTRQGILRAYGVTLVLAGPYERGVGGYVPRGHGYRLIHEDGPVRVFAVEGA